MLCFRCRVVCVLSTQAQGAARAEGRREGRRRPKEEGTEGRRGEGAARGAQKIHMPVAGVTDDTYVAPMSTFDVLSSLTLYF